MTHREAQSLFAVNLAHLVLYGDSRGDAFTFGDVMADHGHQARSLHYDRLAADLNLFVGGDWVEEDHPEWHALGAFWKGLHPQNRWGGDIKVKRDWNHFSMVPDPGDDRI